MEVIQAILIIALAFWIVIDQQGLCISTWFPIMVAFFTGLIMGDMTTAMMIGGTFQLMALGVANIGGSSIPNWGLATLVGIYIAIKSTNNIEEAKAIALAVGVPVGMLGIQLDVLAKILNTYIANAAQKAANRKQYKKMNLIFWGGPLIFGLSTAIPTTLCVIFGDKIVKLILSVVPQWFTDGLSIAGNMLPAVGIALLLHVMPVKKYLTMLLIGFVVSAYLKIPILGISILGFAFAYYYFIKKMAEPNHKLANAESAQQIEGDDFDE
ncbi:PTS sugar transporter subunit IIC [Brenneria goodwinii]|uniref:PTS mannose/fructose/sorbose/N-acetylgalactosamine transporter subunit IIC n=1 Tax=Brenneria goodwinii TaxID=1109412 RepID=UPI000EF27897|nr:PTS sugar transporter subunit IIC [Brenneria goodwinii]MCG8158635.1 PTS sugar transporter subunit IIC [Brenneria goodwinii]MCG8162716.1 PTS sugar transporter subunit IIC [Brenneria goodwinii]MCG8167882.1 PTS sugar transporter subunit IIC [Brenneria goodwinii]MCG8172465.1 PTS sugar transporter subunit IIC [Brenneria goodwinii]MCG8176737.1 PTS sugar transporter subunit IIC [Brenneria goodwinii]